MTLLQSFMEDLLTQTNTGQVVIIRDDPHNGSTRKKKSSSVLKKTTTAPSFPCRKPSVEALVSPPSYPSRKPSFEALDLQGLQTLSLQSESSSSKYDSLEEFYKEVGFTRRPSYQRRRTTLPVSTLYDLPPEHQDYHHHHQEEALAAIVHYGHHYLLLLANAI